VNFISGVFMDGMRLAITDFSHKPFTQFENTKEEKLNTSLAFNPVLPQLHTNLPPSVSRRRKLSASIAVIVSGISIAASLNVHAQTQTSDNPQTVKTQAASGSAQTDSDQLVDTVVVLGTARKDTTVLTSTSPIEVLTELQLKETGATTLNEALSLLDPSFNFPQGQNAVKGMGIRSASLRGVGPGYTLVLVDGKRRNESAMLAGTDPWTPAQVVDLNVIPISAIDHIEVLRDGAAAQYGSDAVAGVVNIILKKDSAGGELNVHAGGYTDSGGATQSITASKGFEIGEDGFVNTSIDVLKSGQVSRTMPDWRQLYPNGDPLNATAGGQYGGQWGQASRNDWKLLANGEIGLGGGARAYGYVNYSNQSSSNWVNFDRVVLPITSPIKGSPDPVTDPYNYDNSYNPWLHHNGNQPEATYGSQDLAALAGVRFGDQPTIGKFDISLAYGNNVTKRWVSDTDNPSWGAASATSFYLGSWKDDTASLTADYVKDVPLSFLIDPAVLSAGLLHRNEHWQTGDNGDPESYTPGPLAGISLATLYTTYPTLYPYADPSANAQATKDSLKTLTTTADLVGIRPQDDYAVSRGVNGGYLGGDFHVTKQFQLGVTARYENYSDFGSTDDYKVTGRYEFTPAVAFRGTLSTGFHAPSLAMLGTQSTSAPSNWSNNGSNVTGSGYTLAFRSSDPREEAFGAKPLEPEKSKTLSLGTVLRLNDTSSITIDAYRLAIDGVITGSQTLSGGAALANAFTSTGLTSYSAGSYDLNAWNSTTSGLDVVGHKQFSLPGASLELSAAASILRTTVSDVNQYVTIGNTQYTVISGYQVRDAERGTPRNKIVLDARYKTGPWILDANFTHYGTYWYDAGNVAGSVSPNGNVDQEFAPEGYVNVGATYKVSNNWHVDFSIQNLFNKYPEQYVAGNSASGINPYSFIAPNGAAGRFLYAGTSYTF
jgi:iron complex outermembrane receptor protein